MAFYGIFEDKLKMKTGDSWSETREISWESQAEHSKHFWHCEQMLTYVPLTPPDSRSHTMSHTCKPVCAFPITSYLSNHSLDTKLKFPVLTRRGESSVQVVRPVPSVNVSKTCDYYRTMYRDNSCITSRYHYTILLLSCQSRQTSWYRHLCTICILTLQQDNRSVIPPHLSALQSVSHNPLYVTLTTVTSCLQHDIVPMTLCIP